MEVDVPHQVEHPSAIPIHVLGFLLWCSMNSMPLSPIAPRRLLNRLARLDVLLIDELSYVNLKPEQSNILFKLMEERYHRHATIVTTNLDYPEWRNFLGNPAMVDALLSRIRHYCHTLRIDGPSLRDPHG